MKPFTTPAHDDGSESQMHYKANSV